MDIKTLTLEQLKALAYDTIANIQAGQRSLEAINQEITLRNQKPQDPKEEDKP